MATGDISQRSGLSDIQSILNIFKGSGTTTNTSTENVSSDKATAYIQQILQGNSGLAAVSSGQKAAGMYNSTVNKQLTDNLLAQTAAQTAALSTSKTTTSSTGAQVNPLKTIAGLAAGQIMAPVIKAGTKKLGLDDMGNDISNAIFGTPAADASTGAAAPIDTSSFSNLNSFLDSTGANLSEPGSASGSSGMDAFAASAGASAAGAAIASGAGDAAVTAGLADASYAIGGTGTFMAADAAVASGAEIAGTAAAATEGAGILDTIGTAAVAMWIICTELNKQGRLPYRFYIYGAREFAKYDERGKQGYYIWAIPSVKHLRKHPNSLYSRALEVVFNARAEYLAAKAGCKGAKKSTLGFLTTHGLYGFCWVLSRTIARKAYTQEQILGAGA